jgi:hypothetical protein
MESESVIAEDIDSVSDVREERTRKYIEEHFVNIDDLAISKDSLCHATTTTPVVTSSDQVIYACCSAYFVLVLLASSCAFLFKIVECVELLVLLDLDRAFSREVSIITTVRSFHF